MHLVKQKAHIATNPQTSENEIKYHNSQMYNNKINNEL